MLLLNNIQQTTRYSRGILPLENPLNPLSPSPYLSLLRERNTMSVLEYF
jgi:hypothetical protein